MENFQEILDKLSSLETKIEDVNKSVEVKAPIGTPVPLAPELSVETKFANVIRQLTSGRISAIKLDKSANAESSDAAGAYLVPLEYGNDMIRTIDQYGIARKLCDVKKMNRDKMNFATVSTDISAYKVSEAASLTASNYIFGQVQLDTEKYAVIVPATNELINDSDYPIQNEVLYSAGIAFANKEDSELISILAGATNSVSAGSTAISTSLTGTNGYEKLVDVIATLEGVNTNYLNGAVWVMSPTTKAVVRKIKDTTGQPILVTVSDGQGLAETILGYPVITTNVMPASSTTTGGTNHLFFGNIKLATLFGDRQAYELLIAKEGTVGSDSLLMNDMSAYRLIGRWDIVLARANAVVKLVNAA